MILALVIFTNYTNERKEEKKIYVKNVQAADRI